VSPVSSDPEGNAVAALTRDIGRRIRDLRKGLGLSQEKLGVKCRLPTSYVGAIERGEKNITIETLSRIGKALQVTLGELVASDELHELRDVDALLRDVPSPMRLRMLQALRDAAVLLKEAALDLQGRRS
jgi:transcriptional regulator with XRE-family HTH domain